MNVLKGNSKKQTWGLVISAVLLLSIFAVELPMVSGGTLIVPDVYPTIQQAVNAANPNDTVYVREGTYYEHVVIDKPLILQGENRETTIMDGGGSGNVIYIRANNVTIQGLTVRNGFRGIFLEHANYCKVDDVIATHCYIGIHFKYSSWNSVTNTIATYNDENGVDVSDRYSQHNTLQNVEAYSNVIHGIAAYLGSHYTKILDCYSHHNKYGISMGWSSNWSIENCVVHSNWYHGIGVDTASHGTVKNCEIYSNGCGIRITGLGCYHNTIIGNRIHSNDIGLAIKSGRYCTIKENVIFNNEYGVRRSKDPRKPAYNNVIFHNDFIDNTFNAHADEDDYTDKWDNGYPDGGNYWSDYTGADEYNGTSQTIPGSDGIGDTPYVINASFKDSYPLMNPYNSRDSDNDGIPDEEDNCPYDSNPEQEDFDQDGLGDVCDPDDDNDGIPDTEDNCFLVYNPEQEDIDGDGLGNACDPDDDNDGVPDTEDNCPYNPNPEQEDFDQDGLGDICDPDDDNDGVPDTEDNCPYNPNPEQEDFDQDGLGDICDPDDDNDGVPDTEDNCPYNPNPDQKDFDQDGLGDACDPDDDNDGIPDTEDNCPYNPNPEQEDFDQDGLGDVCDPDDDNDGIPDELDACPYENPEGYDANLDGCIDSVCDLPQIVQSLGLHPGIENSLVQKASNACRKFSEGNIKTAINMLNAFINEVEAQKGKKISEEDADMLIQFAQNAIQQMEST